MTGRRGTAGLPLGSTSITTQRIEASAPDACPEGCPYHIGYLQPALPTAELEVVCWRPDATSIACRICDGASELTRVPIRRL